MDGFTVVYRASGLAEAEIIRGYLESEEIPADLDYESAGPAIGLTMNGLGEVRVCVRDDLAEAARLALARKFGRLTVVRPEEESPDPEPEDPPPTP